MQLNKRCVCGFPFVRHLYDAAGDDIQVSLVVRVLYGPGLTERYSMVGFRSFCGWDETF